MSDITQLTTYNNKLIGRPILNLLTTSSTMDEAKELAQTGAREGLVIVADNQTKGRGRFDREWLALPGQDLTFSILLKPNFKKLHMLNMIISIAIQDMLTRLTEGTVDIKWPNDVLIAGRKISGILVESVLSSANTVDFTVVGIGINLNLDPAVMEGIEDSATSISHIIGKPVDKYEVLDNLLNLIDERYQAVLLGYNPRGDWSSRLSTIGNRIRVSNGSDTIIGKAIGVDSVGNLIIQTEQGAITVTSGDVTVI